MPGSADRVRRHVYLDIDRWDDWGKFRTMFTMYVVDEDGTTHEPGSVKIGDAPIRKPAELAPDDSFWVGPYQLSLVM